MATTRTGTGTPSTTNPMGVGDVDSRYRTGDDYWTDHNGGPGPQVMAADTLQGDSVRNDAGEDLGEITDIMLDVPTGRVAYAVMSVGGVLGIGDKLFAIPWSALRLDTENKCFRMNVAKERFEQAPGFDKDHWPDMADPTWQNTINSYYGTKSYTDTTYTEPTSTQTKSTSTKDYTTPAHRNDERIIPVAPVGTDHVSSKVDDYTHK